MGQWRIYMGKGDTSGSCSRRWLCFSSSLHMHGIKLGAEEGSTCLGAVLGTTVLGRQPRLAIATAEAAATVAEALGERKSSECGSLRIQGEVTCLSVPRTYPAVSAQVLILWPEHWDRRCWLSGSKFDGKLL